jgi:hypothetical protein
MTGPTAAEIRVYRDTHGVGMMEARRILVREHLIKQLDDASTVDELKAVIRRLI